MASSDVPGVVEKDKMIPLAQLQRYDEKLKRWANDEFLAKADTVVTDVRIADKSITVDGVADIPAAVGNEDDSNKNSYGVVKSRGASFGILFHQDGICAATASTNEIDSRKNHFKPIPPALLDYAVKVAMCDGKGAAWTDEEQAAAKERMGIDNYSLPKATATTLGGVKVGNGLNVTNDGTLSVEMSSGESSKDTTVTATYDNGGTWNAVCKDTYNVIVSWFDKYDHVLAWVGSGEDSLRPFPGCFVELIKMQEGLIVSMPFTIQYVVPSNNPRVRTGMTTTALCQIYFNTDGSIDFQMSYSEVDQYADATEFTNTVNEGVSMLALKDGGITSAKLADGAVTADKIADGAITADKLASGVSGGVHYFEGNASVVGQSGTKYINYEIYPGCFLRIGFSSNKTISSAPFSVYYELGTMGDFISYKLLGMGSKGINVSPSKGIFNSANTVISLNGINTTTTSSGLHGSIRSIGGYSYWYEESLETTTFTIYIPRSSSARAALATLVPVQDECEQMAAEVANLEQDWIDDSDEAVTVDENDVPITIVTKKTELEKKQAELEKKQAELEKLREDYFSKLGDWKNEVQE